MNKETLKKFLRISMQGLLWIIGVWAGFAIPFIIFLFTGIHLLIVLFAFLIPVAILIWIIRKKTFLLKPYALAFLFAISIGMVAQIIYAAFGGWALFGS